MAAEYSTETIRNLQDAVRRERLLRAMRIERYEPGDELVRQVIGVSPAWEARVRVRVERFVGGGFAGQVYRVRVEEVEPAEACAEQLVSRGLYAMKVLVPPSHFAQRFRDAIYAVGFQGAFSLQANPTAHRAAALWQKVIRRAARIRLGDERAVADVLCTFIDPEMGSCAELVEWIEGRNWRLEVDDNLDARRRWLHGDRVDPAELGSREYLAKRQFMQRIVDLLRETGAPELARQYEWWTCKSQPNCLKRIDAGPEPDAGLTAVDLRAGLALLPCLPMSPGDVKLIFDGISRGSWVQFDRGDLNKLMRFVDAHPADFADLRGALEELTEAERAYRRSLPDVTHNVPALLYDRELWSDVLEAAVRGWEVRKLADPSTARRFRRGRGWAMLFAVLGLIPLLGGFLRKAWARGDYRAHYRAALLHPGYLRRAVRGKMAESLIRWHRAGRVGAQRAERLLAHPVRYVLHVPLSLLPARVHRILTDRREAVDFLRNTLVRPVRLYFNEAARRDWLVDMVAEGRRDGMLTDQEAERIESRLDEPFIQKYLKSLAVHLCTLPVTQVVSVVAAAAYISLHPELTWKEAGIAAGAIITAFQIVPVSPGSLTRGLYVLYLVIRERNVRDYNIAVFVSFLKYVGYLAFPIQMAYRYPALARFMAGRWATGATHFVPVFGERGALLEHGVFDLFYNRPLTLRRRMRRRHEAVRHLPVRAWHVPLLAAGAVLVLLCLDSIFTLSGGEAPPLGRIWYLAVWPGFLASYLSAQWAGGATAGRRTVLAVIGGLVVGLGYAVGHTVLMAPPEEAAAGGLAMTKALASGAVTKMVVFALVGVLAAAVEEFSAHPPAEHTR